MFRFEVHRRQLFWISLDEHGFRFRVESETASDTRRCNKRKEHKNLVLIQHLNRAEIREAVQSKENIMSYVSGLQEAWDCHIKHPPDLRKVSMERHFNNSRSAMSSIRVGFSQSFTDLPRQSPLSSEKSEYMSGRPPCPPSARYRHFIILQLHSLLSHYCI
ncbi:hypothetical protein J6590_033342 [Homalodisca vitripennis]|nr:hypothetical protein J6590_033342 [Homalodisca vitripennis]